MGATASLLCTSISARSAHALARTRRCPEMSANVRFYHAPSSHSHPADPPGTSFGPEKDGVFYQLAAPPSPQPQSPQPLPQNHVPRKKNFPPAAPHATPYPRFVRNEPNRALLRPPLRALCASVVSTLRPALPNEPTA